MTESPATSPNPLQDGSSQLALGVESYFAAVRSHLELTAQLTTAWASAMSAMSSSLLAGSSTAAPSGGSEGDQHGRAVWSSSFPSLRSVRDVGGDGNPATDQSSTEFGWARPIFERPATGGMLRWLTEPPTLQTNLFDETIELLLDEDIKTAS